MKTRRPLFASLASLASLTALAVPSLLLAEKKEPAPFPKELPKLAAERPLSPPAVSAKTLGNGLTVWVVNRRGVPLVNVTLVVKGGRTLDEKDQAGFSNLLAEGLKEGTATKTGAQIADTLQGAGAELSTGAGSDSIAVSATGVAEKLDVLLSTVADVAAHPAFPKSAVERVKANALEELATSETDPEFVAVRSLRRQVYGAHPYAVDSPTKQSIERTTPELLRREAARRLVPERALLLVVGEVEPENASRLAAAAFGSWARGSEALPPARAATPARESREALVVSRPGSVQSVLAFGGVGISRTDPEAAALEVAEAIYGGAFSSRLVSNLREEKGYAYSPYAVARSAPQGGLIATVAAVRNEVTGAAASEILYEMSRIATTDPSDEELERARGHQIGSRVLSLQSNAAVAGELADLFRNGLSPADIGKPIEALTKVTAKDVRRVAKKHLTPYAMRLVVVGDLPAVKEELAPIVPIVEEKVER
ncbi:MAG TPA: pitrilysin family protein [Thermoanaerobaculia bacterium]|nr:pitrilysin family protein [Thermoanaerobaculia bacterium]